MPKIKKEYPEGQRSIEIELIRMLREKRSWFDYMEISEALGNIRYHANSMKREQNTPTSSGNISGSQVNPPRRP